MNEAMLILLYLAAGSWHACAAIDYNGDWADKTAFWLVIFGWLPYILVCAVGDIIKAIHLARASSAPTRDMATYFKMWEEKQ